MTAEAAIKTTAVARPIAIGNETAARIAAAEAIAVMAALVTAQITAVPH
ncbi:MAG: hypothetical protein ACM31O_08575 [Bacteroidota bacterium]|jgi:hypothetical protein